MAEAVAVDERQQAIPRFYCHRCRVEINILNTEFTCPLCAGGFVEELPPITPGTSNPPNANISAAPSGVQIQEHPLPLDMDILRNELANLLSSRNGPNLEINIDPISGRVNARGASSNVTVIAGNLRGGTNNNNSVALSRGNSSDSGVGATGSNSGNDSATGNVGGRVGPQNLDRFDNLLLNFLLSISGESEVVPNIGDPPMIFMGNLGDYAWGREGLDSIVTQLLNQMEASGPPPLPKWKIDEIPKVQVTAEEVDKKLQCSVCWEDFVLDEKVLKLSCSHLYHEQCIVPWLDLHGTCPICRKLLDDLCEENNANNDAMNESLDDNSTATGSPRTGPRTRSQTVRVATIAPVTANGNRANSGMRTQQQQQQQTSSNNVFGFEEMDFTNGDLD